MGLNKNEGRGMFLNISNGKIVRQHQNPVEGVTVTRENKNGKVVHEETFDSITGVITSIKSKETPFGMVWEVTVTDGEETFILSWNYSSRYTNHFFRALPNIDIAQEVKINPWSMRDKNDPSKTAIGLSMYQNGNKAEFCYTKDEPRDMPDLVQTKVKGKIQWDDSDQLEFFEAMVKKIFSGAAVSAQEDEDAPF
jgi:hypothetical protein